MSPTREQGSRGPIVRDGGKEVYISLDKLVSPQCSPSFEVDHLTRSEDKIAVAVDVLTRQKTKFRGVWSRRVLCSETSLILEVVDQALLNDVFCFIRDTFIRDIQ